MERAKIKPGYYYTKDNEEWEIIRVDDIDSDYCVYYMAYDSPQSYKDVGDITPIPSPEECRRIAIEGDDLK